MEVHGLTWPTHELFCACIMSLRNATHDTIAILFWEWGGYKGTYCRFGDCTYFGGIYWLCFTCCAHYELLTWTHF